MKKNEKKVQGDKMNSGNKDIFCGVSHAHSAFVKVHEILCWPFYLMFNNNFLTLLKSTGKAPTKTTKSSIGFNKTETTTLKSEVNFTGSAEN